MISDDPIRSSARKCLLVEDEPNTREWLRKALINAFGDIEVVAAGSVSEAHACIDLAGSPDHRDFSLALIDLGLPDGSGTSLVRRLAAERPGTLTIVATIYDDDAHLFEAIAAGARGYLLKDGDSDLLAGYLRRINLGEPPLSPAIAHRILAHFRMPAVSAYNNEELTAREIETLGLLSNGLTVAEAATHMGLRPQTVASYVKVIYQKLNITSRAEATREAIRRGLR
ncbi:MAG: response regulator transcription factor [Pseudomonadota bacterium]